MIRRAKEDYNGYVLDVNVDEYCVIVQALEHYLLSTNKNISFYEEFIKKHDDSFNEEFKSKEQLSYFLNRKKIIECIIYNKVV